MKTEWVSLRDEVKNLILEGKRSSHEEFKRLFDLFGEEKIRAMANGILKEEKSKDEVPQRSGSGRL